MIAYLFQLPRNIMTNTVATRYHKPAGGMFAVGIGTSENLPEADLVVASLADLRASLLF